MPEVGSAARAQDLLANHAVGHVFLHADGLTGERQEEARPAGPGIVLVIGTEQRRIATDAVVIAVALVIDVLPREGPFSALVLGSVKRC